MITPEVLKKDGWERNEEYGWHKPLPNQNPINNTPEETGLKLILHFNFNIPQFAVLFPDGGMLNFNVENFDDLKRFEKSIYFYNAPF